MNPLLRIVPVWLAGNMLIGLCAILPIGVADNFIYYIRAVNGDSVVRPYGSDGARFAVVEFAVLAASVLVVAVFFNRRQWRRLRGARPVSPPVVLAATVVLQSMPVLWFYLCADRSF